MTQEEKDKKPSKPLEAASAVAPQPPAKLEASSIYQGMSSIPFDEHQAKILMAQAKTEDLKILPTGEVYLPQIKYRVRLNEAFGPGGWALLPIGTAAIKGNHIMREYVLMVNGRFVAQAPGEAEYVPTNPRMSYATAVEAAKSNALMRCCKDIGIAAECWDKDLMDAFKKVNCVQVFVSGASKPRWRLKTDPPLTGEQKIVGQGGKVTKEPQAIDAEAS